jgi:hypothetical protein
VTSFRQIEANRRNAFKSTGPTTTAGKQRSRRNAVRHGLTAETVITTLEDEEDYRAFELSVTSGFDAPTAVERELVLRLASLLWRLRRATAIDTGLLQLQSEIINELKRRSEDGCVREAVCNGTTDCSKRTESIQLASESNDSITPTAVNCRGRNTSDGPGHTPITSRPEIARCFLRLANLDNGAFELANRYETALWRQIGQVLLTLDFLRRT